MKLILIVKKGVSSLKRYSISPKSLTEQTYQVIKEAIIEGVLSDNEALTEKKAKELFDISRTPFREAIQRLESEEWVYSIPYKGTFVSAMTMREVEEILQIRLIIETAIAKQVAENITVEQIELLHEINNRLQLKPDLQSDYDFTLIDQEFHKTINGFSHNKQLKKLSENIYDSMRRIAMNVLKEPIRRKKVVEEHQEIIKGLETNHVEVTLIHHYDRVRFGAQKYFSKNS